MIILHYLTSLIPLVPLLETCKPLKIHTRNTNRTGIGPLRLDGDRSCSLNLKSKVCCCLIVAEGATMVAMFDTFHLTVLKEPQINLQTPLFRQIYSYGYFHKVSHKDLFS